MALVTRFITYELPNLATYDQLLLYESTTESGTFSLDQTLSYQYLTRATEVDNLNTDKWYKIRFYDTVNALYSPYSDVFYGGHYDDKEPFACVTSTFDGAGFATASGFYTTTRLKTEQVSVGLVKDALKTARAYVDVTLDDVSPYKYSIFVDTDNAKRKYNANIEITRKVEIYFAAALIYHDMADDQVMVGLSGSFTSLSVQADLTADTDVSGVVDVSGVADITADADLDPRAIDPTGYMPASGYIAATISIGQTTIGDQERYDAVDAARFNVDKDLNIAKFNQEKELDVARFNVEKELNLSRFNQEKELSIARFNQEKGLSVAQHNIQKNLEYARYLDAREVARQQALADFLYGISKSYAAKADALMNVIRPSTVRLRYNEIYSLQRFVNPADGIFPFAAAIPIVSVPTFNENTATLTGLGASFSGVFYALSAANMANNPVNGVSGQAVFPLESATSLIASNLVVNGVTYYLDDWTDHNGVVLAGAAGAISGAAGYSLSYDTGDDFVEIEWNYTDGAGGFDIDNTDLIVLTYWTY